MDRKFIYKMFARIPRDPTSVFFIFFMRVLNPGRYLDGFATHFSSRYTHSDPRISILHAKSFNFHRKSAPPDPPKAPAVPTGLHLGLGMDLGWFGEGHMRSSMVNNSKLELFGTQPRMPRELRERLKWWQEVQLGAPSHTRRGPDDGSYTDSLK